MSELSQALAKIAELTREVQRLTDIEAIKRVKYRYFRCFDTANVAELADVFTDDVTLSVVGGVYQFKLTGRQEYLNMVRDGAHAEMITQHNGHHPEIDVLSDTEARGTWYLHDNVLEFRRRMHITGTALYRDQYRKENGRWKIAYTEFERIYEISEELRERPNVTFHYLATHGHKLPDGDLAPFKKEP
jgi:ketosteroid isomerase-like protein